MTAVNGRVGKRPPDKTTGRNTKLRLSIVNIVATAKLGQRVDIEGLVGVEGFSYDQAIYPCAYLKDGQTIGKVSIFQSGKIVSVGTKSLKAARGDLTYALRRLEEAGVCKAYPWRPIRSHHYKIDFNP